MIYHIQTFCTYGYWVEDLAAGSHKPIVMACDRCGEIRVRSKRRYRDLCPKCARIKRFEDPKEREKQRQNNLKRYEDPLEHEKTSKGNKKRYEDPLEREKTSKAGRKHYAEMDDPGLEIVGHHIAYDFGRPEAFIIKITRRFHGHIHHPKGQSMYKRGYSLID